MLAQLVARRLPGGTIEQARELVRAGAVYMGHLRVRVPTVRVASGERITVHLEALTGRELGPDAVVFVHRDPHFVVLDKPAGVAVSATRESARGTLSEALRRVLEQEGLTRPYVGVVHRLDRGASGLVLFTVRSVANQSLHKQFVEHAIERSYRVLVHGDAPPELMSELPLLEQHSGTSKPAPDNPHAKPARTRFRRLAAAHPQQGTTLLEAELETGRHHQIRVHAAALGHPIVGDRRYGTDDGADRLHLHAWRLAFAHPVEGNPIEVVAELPEWARAT
jgi:23S rRNA pseudouridine1911/1915/1917 synthase